VEYQTPLNPPIMAYPQPYPRTYPISAVFRPYIPKRDNSPNPI